MALGDLLTLPGQVEWDELLIDVAGISTGLWFTTGSDVDQWVPLWETRDTASLNMVSPGRPTPVLTYPTLTGVAVETAELVADLERAMARSTVARDLCWWDQARDRKFKALAKPRGVTTGTAQGTQHYPHKVVGLSWLFVDKYLLSLDEHETPISGSNPTVPNNGSEPAPWKVEVAGPCVAPRIRNLTTGQAWRFDDLSLTSGQTLTVDTRRMTAVVSEAGEDDVSVWHLASDDGGKLAMLWGIAPGGTPVGFARTSGTSTATLTNPDAY